MSPNPFQPVLKDGRGNIGTVSCGDLNAIALTDGFRIFRVLYKANYGDIHDVSNKVFGYVFRWNQATSTVVVYAWFAGQAELDEIVSEINAGRMNVG